MSGAPQSHRITKEQLNAYVQETFGVQPAHPFLRNPEVVVYKHRSNKWFGIVMTVPYRTLKIEKEGLAEVLNVKADPVFVQVLVQNPGYLPAYHMNKKHWVSVLLDGSAKVEDIKSLLAESYELTR